MTTSPHYKTYPAITVEKLKPLVGLFLLSSILTFLNPRFLTLANIMNVFRQTSVNAIPAIGMTFVILTGGIDLSVGSVLALTGAIVAYMLRAGVNVLVSVAGGVALGVLLGALTGLIITKQKVPPFIATLAFMAIYRGATMVLTGGQPITGLGDSFAFIGCGYVGPVPFPVLLLAVISIGGWFILAKTRFGEHIYATGGNEDAAYLSGVSVHGVKASVYAISGLLAAVCGMVVASRLDSAQPVAGLGLELDAIAAVILGGTSLSGGKGHIPGTLIGALIIGVINNGLNLIGLSSFYQQLVKGGVILVAVLLDRRK
ncbi:MAG: ribose ABC transporter permease [Bacillota bacterium]|nr:ribose ABC transporter permease [Bacillota bacterium]